MSSIYDWSLNAGSNANADGSINWREGQAPSTVNNSARSMMERNAELVADIGGALVAGGTVNDLTVTANSAFGAYNTGVMVAFRPTAANTGAATLNVNSLGARSIRTMTPDGDKALSGNELQADGIFVVHYNASLNGGSGGWQLINSALGSSGAFGNNAVYGDPNAAASLAVNGVPETGGGFPRTAPDEVKDAYSGGNPSKSLMRLAATDLAQCMILPPTEDQMNFTYPTCPYVTVRTGSTRRVIPVDIRTVLFNSPLNIPLFQPVTTNNCGFLTWKYIGDYPIHTVISGSFSVMVRTSFDGAGWLRNILELTAVDVPSIEKGQSDGDQFLGWSSPALDSKTTVIANREGFNDKPGPITPELITAIAGESNLYTGDNNGYIETDSIASALTMDDPAGSGTPVGAEVRTTDWITVTGITDLDKKLFAFYGDDSSKYSTRCRIQISNYDESIIQYLSGMSGDNAVNGNLFRIPSGTNKFRVYYCGPGDNFYDQTLYIKAVPDTIYDDSDPLDGNWVMHTYNIHRDVTFWPDSTYALTFLTFADDTAVAREWGFRFQSGGMSFLFDAGALRKTVAGKLFED